MPDRIRMTCLDPASWAALDRWRAMDPDRAVCVWIGTGYASLTLTGPLGRHIVESSRGERTWPEVVAAAIAESDRRDEAVAQQERELLERASATERARSDAERAP